MKLPALTSLRFVFAVMVFLCHLTYFRDSGIPWLQDLLKYYLRYGYLGVNFFFMLSGFVLSYTYAGLIADQRFSIKEFLIKRIIRIVPLHYVTLLIAIPLVVQSILGDGGFSAHHTFQFLVKLMAHLTLTQSFIPAIPYYFSFNYPSWSISAEMFFYLVFPFAIALVFRKGLLRSYVYYLLLLITAFLLMTVIRSFYDLHWLFYINPMVRILDFFMGIFLFFFYRIVTHNHYITSIKATILQALSLLLMLVFFMGIQKVYQVYAYSLYFYVPMAMIIFSFANQEGWLSKLLSLKWLVFLGEASYSFYLTQDLTARYMNWNGNRLQIIEQYFNGSYIVFAAFQFILALAIAIVVHLIIEKPLNRFLLRKTKTYFEK
jgi:peptidoglycan/LPS O-acetylase OafA/YrhL